MATHGKRDNMDAWPHISRARVIRFNLVAGSVTLALVAIYVVLMLAGSESSGLGWFPVILFGGTGILELLGAWAARRDQAREDAAAARAARQRA